MFDLDLFGKYPACTPRVPLISFSTEIGVEVLSMLVHRGYQPCVIDNTLSLPILPVYTNSVLFFFFNILLVFLRPCGYPPLPRRVITCVTPKQLGGDAFLHLFAALMCAVFCLLLSCVCFHFCEEVNALDDTTQATES